MEDLIPIPMFKLYGNMTQEERRGTYLKFCKTKNGVLFCTDVGIAFLSSHSLKRKG
jgi:superfamily II DNA/RNA helicase